MFYGCRGSDAFVFLHCTQSPNDGLPGSWEVTVSSTWLSPPFSCIGSGSWILPCASCSCSCSWRWWSVLGWSWNCDIFLINNSATSIFSFSFWSAYAGRREKERKQWGSLEERKKVRYKTPDEFSSHIYNHENENTVIFSVVWAIFSRLLWLVFLCTFSRERKRQTDRERAGGEGGTFQTHPRRRIQCTSTHRHWSVISPLSITPFIRRVERGFLRFLLSLSPSVPFSPEFRKIKCSYQGESWLFFSFLFLFFFPPLISLRTLMHSSTWFAKSGTISFHTYISDIYTPSTLKLLYYSISFTPHFSSFALSDALFILQVSISQVYFTFFFFLSSFLPLFPSH